MVVFSLGMISVTEWLENRANPLRLPLGTVRAFAEKGSGSESVMMDKGKERRSLGPSVGGSSPERKVEDTDLEDGLEGYFEGGGREWGGWS